MTITADISPPDTSPGAAVKRARHIGRGLSLIVILFLLMDATMKLLAMPIVIQSMGELGWPQSDAIARGLGLLLLLCTTLYCLPRTSVLGAILLTAYLGGAVASHVRIGNPLFSHDLFGVYIGILAWGGLYLRNTKLRTLLALRTAS